jgi:hypothetical protein
MPEPVQLAGFDRERGMGPWLAKLGPKQEPYCRPCVFMMSFIYKGAAMNIFYIIGVIVVIIAILSFLGLR